MKTKKDVVFTPEQYEALLRITQELENRSFCNCCKKYSHINGSVRYLDSGDAFDGKYWECECGSTLFKPFKRSA